LGKAFREDPIRRHYAPLVSCMRIDSAGSTAAPALSVGREDRYRFGRFLFLVGVQGAGHLRIPRRSHERKSPERHAEHVRRRHDWFIQLGECMQIPIGTTVYALRKDGSWDTRLAAELLEGELRGSAL
jgi:hypothetical protein